MKPLAQEESENGNSFTAIFRERFDYHGIGLQPELGSVDQSTVTSLKDECIDSDFKWMFGSRTSIYAGIFCVANKINPQH